MNAPWILLFLLILLLGGWQAALGQTGPLDVRLRGPGVVEVAAGDAVTVPFQISRGAGTGGRFEAAVGLPAGWRVVAGDGPFDLEPGSSLLRLVSVAVPSHAPAGSHVIRFAAGGPDRQEAHWSADSVEVQVPVRVALELSLEPMPERVAAGEPYQAHLLLRNRGNTPISSRIRAESSGGYPVEVSPTDVELEPGGTAPITVIVRTEGDLSRQRREILRITATPTSPVGEETRVNVPLDVVPRARDISERGDQRHRLPLRATVRAASDHDTAVPFEVSGSGRLFDSGSERIDFLLRGPGTGASVLGQRDEYRVTLRSDRLNVRLGDQNYALTPLTERGRYGFGAAAGVSLGDWTISGHHAWDRRLSQGAQSAAQFGYARSGVGLDLSYLTREGLNAGSLWSVRGRARPLTGMRLEAEYGRGLEGGEEETGSSVEWSGRHARLGYRFQQLRTGSRFPSSMAGFDLRHGAVDLTLWGGLRIAGHRTHTERMLGAAGGFLLGTRLNRTSGASLTHPGLGSLEYRVSEQAVLHSGAHDESESLRLRLGWTPGKWALTPSVEAGRNADRLAGSEGPFHVLQMRASYRPAGGGSASASLERFAGRRFSGAASQEGITGRFNWSSPFGGATRASLNLAATLDTRDGGTYSGFGDATLTREIFSGHELGIRVRTLSRVRGTGSPDPTFVVSYTIPFQVPISSSREWGRIAGRVYDVESGEGLSNVLVHVAGQQALTDGRGNLEIRGIEPGDYRVGIDRTNETVGLMPANESMLDAAARSGLETRLEIGMIRAAQLTGAVRRYEPAPGSRPDDPDPEMVDVGGVRDAVVELTRGSEVHRRTTDAEGRFHFSEVRPGEWTVSVAADVPAWHRLEPETAHLSFGAGADEELAIRVIATPRTLRIIPQRSVESVTDDAVAPPEAVVPETLNLPPARYTVTPRDISLMNVARIVYDDVTLWPKLWVANRDQLACPDVIRAGQELRVPPKGALTQVEISERRRYYDARDRSPSPSSCLDRSE